MPSAAPKPAVVEVGVQPAAGTAQGEERVNDAVSWHIDKRTLALSEPRRYRDPWGAGLVMSLRCRSAARTTAPSIGEAAWWKSAGIDAVTIAQRLWQHTRLSGAPIQRHIDPLLGPLPKHEVDDSPANPSAGPVDQ
jgi:hypothetical protein